MIWMYIHSYLFFHKWSKDLCRSSSSRMISLQWGNDFCLITGCHYSCLPSPSSLRSNKGFWIQSCCIYCKNLFSCIHIISDRVFLITCLGASMDLLSWEALSKCIQKPYNWKNHSAYIIKFLTVDNRRQVGQVVPILIRRGSTAMINRQFLPLHQQPDLYQVVPDDHQNIFSPVFTIVSGEQLHFSLKNFLCKVSQYCDLRH